MTRSGRVLWHLVVGLLLAVTVQTAEAQEGPSLIIVVRHAEKAAVPGADPPLSDEGKARAAALAATLMHTPVNAIVTSTFRRTFDTAADVAGARGLTFQKIAIGRSTANHVAEVAAAVRAQSGVVLVVGHSNTVPAIVAALGGPKLGDICEAHYSNLLILSPLPSGTPSLTTANYGVADPVNAPGCASSLAPSSSR